MTKAVNSFDRISILLESTRVAMVFVDYILGAADSISKFSVLMVTGIPYYFWGAPLNR